MKAIVKLKITLYAVIFPENNIFQTFDCSFLNVHSIGNDLFILNIYLSYGVLLDML